MIAADQRLFQWINGFVGTWPWFDNTMTLLVSDFFLPVLIAGLAWSLWLLGKTPAERIRNQMGFIYAGAGAGFANLFVRFMNDSFDRARPFEMLNNVNLLFYAPTDPSFPSNAAAFAFGTAAGAWLVHKPMGVLIGVLASLFCIARVYAGMHFPLDVLGGALIGILTAYAFAFVLGFFRSVVRFAFRLLRAFYLA